MRTTTSHATVVTRYMITASDGLESLRCPRYRRTARPNAALAEATAERAKETLGRPSSAVERLTNKPVRAVARKSPRSWVYKRLV